MSRLPLLLAVARWLLGVLVLRVLVAVVGNYPGYFPPDFRTLFLEGRERTFHGWYAVAFYIHILSAPWALLAVLVLLSGRVRRRWPAGHRRLGRAWGLVVLLLVVPSAAAMSRRAFAGPAAGASFLLLSVALAGCTVCGWRAAVRRRFAAHRRWMLRAAVLLGSAVTLRLLSGAASVLGVSDPEGAYVAAAWASWLLPLAGCELALAGRVSGSPAFFQISARPGRP